MIEHAEIGDRKLFVFLVVQLARCSIEDELRNRIRLIGECSVDLMDKPCIRLRLKSERLIVG